MSHFRAVYKCAFFERAVVGASKLDKFFAWPYRAEYIFAYSLIVGILHYLQLAYEYVSCIGRKTGALDLCTYRCAIQIRPQVLRNNWRCAIVVFKILDAILKRQVERCVRVRSCLKKCSFFQGKASLPWAHNEPRWPPHLWTRHRSCKHLNETASNSKILLDHDQLLWEVSDKPACCITPLQ